MKHSEKIRWQFLSVVVLLVAVMTGCTTIQPLGVKDIAGPAGTVFSHNDFDHVLSQFVDGRGMVDYTALKNDPQHLENYYRLIATYSPDSHPHRFPGNDHKLAYWINAYNAAAIKTVLTRYPINSVIDIKTPALFFFLSNKAGFFYFQRLSFGGKTTSLYYLENKVVRKRFKDPRIHFALNCASVGCPRLPRKAFSGDTLDEQLDNETRLFLSEARNFDIDHEARAIKISSIFKWYREDFTTWYAARYADTPASLLNYIVLYLTPERADALREVMGEYALEFIPYDWNLNDQKNHNP